MEASEWMIGNAVKVHGHPKCRVIGVNHGEVVTLWSETDDDEIECFERVSPITITEKFLERNGFVLDDDIEGFTEEKFYLLKLDKFTITIHEGSNTIGRDWWIHIDNGDGCTIASADVQYVHQLQNILNIMNIKFDIVL